MKNKKFAPPLTTIFYLLALGIILSLIVCFSTALIARQIKLQKSYTHLESVYPSFVVQNVNFSKYIMHGTTHQQNMHFTHLSIYLVQGSAQIKIDMSGFSINKAKTKPHQKTLVLDCVAHNFISGVDIFIEPEGIHLVEEINPKEFSEEELKSIRASTTKGAIFLGAGAGALTSVRSDQQLNPLGNAALGLVRGSHFANELTEGLVGAGIGAGAGALLAGGASYVFTPRFVVAMQTALTSKEDLTSILRATKPLIAQEILGEHWNERAEAEHYYKAKAQKKIKELARELGWKEVYIQYVEAPL